MQVCKGEDWYTVERMRWVARLSNGEIVLQDDERPGVYPPQAWLRLANYLKENNLSLDHLHLQFRSHVECPLPDNAEGYFFTNKAAAFIGCSTIGFYLIGYLKDDKVHLSSWQVPEILLEKEETRSVSSVDYRSLIRNNRGLEE